MVPLCLKAVQVAPLRLCFYLPFYLLLLSLFTHITSALITYDKGRLLDIGHRYTNLFQDTLSPNPSWPLEILGYTEENNGHLNNHPRRRIKKHRGKHSQLLANRTMPPFSSHRNINKASLRRVVTRWSSHSEAMLQAALDDVDWDMFRASSSDVSEFTDVAVSFVNTLTEQATETITVRTFPNQKPWVDRAIRAAVNKRTAAYNAGLLSGNMSEYKASCYALRRAVRAAKLRYRERIESHFQLNDACGRD